MIYSIQLKVLCCNRFRKIVNYIKKNWKMCPVITNFQHKIAVCIEIGGFFCLPVLLMLCFWLLHLDLPGLVRAMRLFTGHCLESLPSTTSKSRMVKPSQRCWAAWCSCYTTVWPSSFSSTCWLQWCPTPSRTSR